jgi:hypothetical protein
VLIIRLVGRTPSVLLLVACVRPSRYPICRRQGLLLVLLGRRNPTIAFLLRIHGARARAASWTAVRKRIVLVPDWETIGVGHVSRGSLYWRWTG